MSKIVRRAYVKAECPGHNVASDQECARLGHGSLSIDRADPMDRAHSLLRRLPGMGDLNLKIPTRLVDDCSGRRQRVACGCFFRIASGGGERDHDLQIGVLIPNGRIRHCGGRRQQAAKTCGCSDAQEFHAPYIHILNFFSGGKLSLF